MKTKHILSVLIGIVLVSFSIHFSYAQLADSPYPKFQYDTTNGGQSPFIGSQTNAVEWSLLLKESLGWDCMISAPAIGNDGTIYLTMEDTLYAVEPVNKEIIWSKELDIKGGPWWAPVPWFPPTISSEGTIYIGSTNGCLYAINLDGSLKWPEPAQFNIGSELWVTPPNIGTDGMLYVCSISGGQTWLHAVDPGNGNILWTVDGGGIITEVERILTFPAIGDDGTIFFNGGNGVHAVNPDGSLKWSKGYISLTHPVIGNEGAVFLYGYEKDAIELELKLFALDTGSGNLKWSLPFGYYYWPSYRFITINQSGTIFLCDVEGVVFAVNSEIGEMMWEWFEGMPLSQAPNLGADGTIYLPGQGGILALGADGAIKWYYSQEEFFTSGAIGRDGRLYTACSDGNLYAFEPPTNELLVNWTWWQNGTMGENYLISLDITNASDMPKTVDIMLSEESLYDGSASWEIDDKGSIKKPDGIIETNGQVADTIILQPGESRTLSYNVNHKWFWIEPWTPMRVIWIVEKLMAAGINLEILSSSMEAFQIVQSLISRVEEIEYRYQVCVNNKSESFTIPVEVGDDHKRILGNSVLEGFLGSLATAAAGCVEYLTPPGIALLSIEAGAIISSEALYATAADPQEDYMEIAIPDFLPLDEFEELEDKIARSVLSKSIEMMAYSEAAKLSFIRYYAALQNNDMNWAFVHMNLFRSYLHMFLAISKNLNSIISQTIPNIPIPDDEKIEAIRNKLLQFGLPEFETKLLYLKGYSEENISFLTSFFINVQDEFYKKVELLPTIWTKSNDWLEALLQDLPVLEGIVVDASIEIAPHTLNLQSKGKWIKCYVALPEEYSLEDVRLVSFEKILLADASSWDISDFDGDGKMELIAKFDRQEIIQYFQENEITGETDITVSGYLSQGYKFSGECSIKIISQPPG